MSKQRALVPFLACLLLAPALAAAKKPKIEITPFVGFRLQGDFDTSNNFGGFFNPFDDLSIESGESFGLVLDFAVSRGFMIELILSRQESTLELDGFLFEDDVPIFDLDVDYLHAGFIYRWTPGQVHPFVGASIGLTRLDPTGIDTGSIDRPSFSLGGGAKIFVTDHIGFRFEGRAFWTFIDDDVDNLCDFGCGFGGGGSVFLIQPELRTGVIFAF